MASHGQLASRFAIVYSLVIEANNEIPQPNFRRFGWHRGVFSGTSRNATAASAGNVQLSCVATVATPGPP